MPEAGWYDDPEDGTQLRWWDGQRWTDQRRPQDDDLAPPPPPPSTPPPPEDPWANVPRAGGGVARPASGWSSTQGPAFATVGIGAAPPRTFLEAVKVCLTKYVDGKGRASRSEYWYFALFTLIVDVLTAGVAAIFLLLPSITVTVRRLHDVGRSAWSLLLVLVPFVGVFVLLYFMVRPGDPHRNAWG